MYLPLHALAQLVSAVLYWIRPVPHSTPQHSNNPLELGYVVVPYGAFRVWHPPFPEPIRAVLRRFGV